MPLLVTSVTSSPHLLQQVQHAFSVEKESHFRQMQGFVTLGGDGKAFAAGPSVMACRLDLVTLTFEISALFSVGACLLGTALVLAFLCGFLGRALLSVLPSAVPGSASGSPLLSNGTPLISTFYSR